MKLVRWSFLGLYMPMMETEQGELYCTTKSIGEALGVSEVAIRVLASNHKDEFDKSLSVTNCNAKDFFLENKVEFGLQRIRKDVRLWSESDMLTIAFHAKTPQSVAYRKQLIQFIKLNARKDYVSKEEFDILQGRLEHIGGLLAEYMPAANQTASLAGSMLRAQRGTKHLRLVVNQESA